MFAAKLENLTLVPRKEDARRDPTPKSCSLATTCVPEPLQNKWTYNRKYKSFVSWFLLLGVLGGWLVESLTVFNNFFFERSVLMCPGYPKNLCWNGRFSVEMFISHLLSFTYQVLQSTDYLWFIFFCLFWIAMYI